MWRVRPSNGTADGGARPGWLRGVLAGLAAAVSLAWVAPSWVRSLDHARRTIRQGLERSLAEQVLDDRGAGFVDAVEEVTRLVPPRSTYLLVADPFGPGAIDAIGVRLALLPRRPVLFERYGELPGEPLERPRATVVIEGDGETPIVFPGASLLDRFDPGALGTEDPDLPASVDEAVSEPSGRVRVRGWCQGAGGVRCDVAAVLVNGRSVPVSKTVRQPRPDVEAAVPRVGACPEAGFLLTVPRGVTPRGDLGVRVVFRTADGRWRVYAERRVEAAP